MNRFPSRSRSAAGFTLIEIIVSIAVLGLMMIGVAQILNGTLITSLGASKHMDADTQARMVLDRMAYDISHITKRTDVDYYFQKNATGGAMNGNDQMAFYSESSGYYPTGVSSSSGGGEVSLVGYMIINNQLSRLSKGLAWNGYSSSLPAMVFNPLANATGASITSNSLTTTWTGIAGGTDPNYQVIGDQVFRLEYTFLVQTAPSGIQTNGVQSTANKTFTGGGFYDKPWSPTTTSSTPNGMGDVTAIVVSIAVLDNKSRAMLGASAGSLLNTACNNLADDKCTSATLTNYSNGPAAGYLPLTLWKATLNSSNLGLPKEVGQQVRFYQRFCYLNHLQ